MKVTFGLPSTVKTFSAEMPSPFPMAPHYTVPYADESTRSQLIALPLRDFATSHLRFRTEISTSSGSAEIYEHRDDRTLLGVLWRAGESCFYTQVKAANISEEAITLQSVLERLSVRLDREGIPRAHFRDGAIGARAAFTPQERELVSFMAASRATPVWSVRFRSDGAMGRDSKQLLGAASLVMRTTVHGVTVICSGAAGSAREVEEVTDAVAASVTRG